MNVRTRALLVLAAMLVGLFVAGVGRSFSYVADPGESQTAALAFWILVGAAVTAPMWVPASVPASYPRFLLACRWLGAVALLPHLYIVTSTLGRNVKSLASGHGGTPSGIVTTLVLTGVVAGCIVLLLRGSRRAAAQTRGPS